MSTRDFITKLTGKPTISVYELDDYCEELFEYFVSEMPYGTAKARDGDPDLWIFDRLEEEGLIELS